MYAQHVRKWSLTTKLMPLISLVFYVSYILLLITCAPTTTAAAAVAAANTQQQQQQQHSLSLKLAANSDAIGAGSAAEEEAIYYIAVDNNGSGGVSESGSNNKHILSSSRSSGDVSVSSSSGSSNSLSSNSNIKLMPATVFAQHNNAAAVDADDDDDAEQHVAATPQSMQKVPNMLNSQIFKLLYNGLSQSQQQRSGSKKRRHLFALTPATTTTTAAAASQQQQQQPPQQTHSAGNSSQQPPPQRYLIESYELPDSLPLSNAGALTPAQRMLLQQQAARNRRDFSQQQFQQMQQQHRAAQQKHKHDHHHQQQQQQQQQQQHNKQQAAQRQRGKQRKRGHRRNQRKNRGRNRPGRYCSARDPGQLAFEAPTVFEGKIISMTPDRRVNFSATVEVKHVYKQQLSFRLPKYVRLQFALRNNSGECDIYREQLLPRGLVRGDDLEQGVTYMHFVQQKDLGNFTILGQPIRSTQQVVNAVNKAVNENYAQLASITSLTASNTTMEIGKELHITCNVEGRPPPKVTWFKDDKSINRKSNLYLFKHHKRRSELIIRSFNSSDAGIYQCRAKNKVSKTVERRRIMIYAFPVPANRPDSTRSSGYPCPDNVGFCFHGGTCKLIPELNSFYCNCPDGFVGERCESKANSVPDSRYSNPPECGENIFFGGFYC